MHGKEEGEEAEIKVYPPPKSPEDPVPWDITCLSRSPGGTRLAGWER